MALVGFAFSGTLRIPASVAAEAISRDGAPVWKGTIRLGEATWIELPTGEYLVRAQLPSGQLATAFAASPSPHIVYLEPEYHSPREYLGWAYYLENPGTGSARDPFQVDDVGVWFQIDGDWRNETVRGMEYSGWLETYGVQARYEEFHESAEDGFVAVLTLNLASRGLIRTSGKQVWLRVRDRFCAVPLDPDMPTSVLITYDRDAPAISFENASGDAQALLGYMDLGAFQDARILGRDVLDLRDGPLLHTMGNSPTASIVAGYYLVRFAQEEFQSRRDDSIWPGWVAGLASQFKDFPDTAVIAARAALLAGDLISARGWLLESFERGLPLYSAGVICLADSLRMLVPVVDDSELRDALAWATSALSYTSRTTQTTSLRDDGAAGMMQVVYPRSLTPAGASL